MSQCMVSWIVMWRRKKLPVPKSISTSRECVSLGPDLWSFSDKWPIMATSKENLVINLFVV